MHSLTISRMSSAYPPARSQFSTNSSTSDPLDPTISTLPTLTVQLLLSPRHFISVPTLVDSGSSSNFILRMIGYLNISLKSDGITARFSDGVRPASKTVSPTSLYPCLVTKLNLVRFRQSHLTTRTRMCSANRQPQSYHRTGHGIVPLTCCLEQYSARVDYTPCQSRSASSWRIASKRLSNNSSFVLPPFQQP